MARTTKTSFKPLMLAVFAASISATAGAASNIDEFDVEFKFVRTAPVQDTYADFRQTARRACRARSRTITVQSDFRNLRACEAELVGKAVHETRIPALIAYHSGLTETPPAPPPH